MRPTPKAANNPPIAAIANGEWVEAIKALKRTRAMSGPDEVLDERIRFVESHLAEMGQLEAPAEPPAPMVLPVMAPGVRLPARASYSSSIQVMCWPVVMMSGAGTSRLGPMVLATLLIHARQIFSTSAVLSR